MGQRDSVLARLAVEAELSLTSAKLKEASGTCVAWMHPNLMQTHGPK